MKVTRKDQTYADLKQRVLTLDLAPGSALDEVLLSTRYELSRTPLREVLQRLAGEGYLNLEANRGASVASMDLPTMRNFFQSAPMIYAAIARLAAEQATQQQIKDLEKTQQQFSRAVKRSAVADMALHNHRFHEHIGEMAASPYLAPSLGRLLIDHTRIGQRFYEGTDKAAKQRIKLACDQHDAMVESFRERNPAQSVELTLKHWELSRREMDRYVLPDPLPLDEHSQLSRGVH